MSATSSATLETIPVAAGGVPLSRNRRDTVGAFVTLDGVPSYRIDSVDRMDPFFVSVVSDANHWLFASSTGALSAGRRAPEHALFPYETVDRIHAAQGQTGSKTLFLVTPATSGKPTPAEAGGAAAPQLWEPFSQRYDGVYDTRRSLTKSLDGDRLTFEEVNESLGLTFSVTWLTSRQFGFVKRARLHASGQRAERGVSVRVLDGVQNLMAYGIDRDLFATSSVLTDAYRKNERVDGTTLCLFTLSAVPVDRAEPSEALKATTVWSAGLEPEAVLLSTRQLDAFRAGAPLESESAVRAQRGAYFVEATLDLAGGDAAAWDTVLDIEQDVTDVIALVDQLEDADALREDVWTNVDLGTRRLRALVGGADGAQLTAEPMTTARHRMNVLFNLMRGGAFDAGYTVERDDVRAHVAHFNAPVAKANADLFDGLPPRLSIQDLRDAARARGPQMERLCASYLPLSFSRRHGDPSRPWNHFAIELRNEDGTVKRSYQGNWRDIFQNWEALGRSYPGYLEAFVATFVNASTADGYNPYRITDQGIDWETVEPDDPWSYIGYWGDHQLIYLLRLLTMSRAHHPGRLGALLGRRVFSYANVPYRIASYGSLLDDPHDTVTFDDDLDAAITERVAAIGADGKLLLDADGDVLLVTLAEKLLVPLLAKLTNFVPGGGIWMNTQRPEWNDANNALVGYGVSMVTLFALRRYLDVLRGLLDVAGDTVELSAEVADLLRAVSGAFEQFEHLAERDLTDAERKQVMDALGQAGGAYRDALYADGLSGTTRAVPTTDAVALLDRAQAFADHTVAANRRADGLSHSYNLLATEPASAEAGGAPGAGTAQISHLYTMLEGQVAALDSGVLSPSESLDVLRALRASDIYRANQHSYRLYPDRELPGFLDKNNIPADAVEASALIGALIAAGDTSVVVRDVQGGVHFNGDFRNKDSLDAALGALSGDLADAVARDGGDIFDVFEGVFDHRAYTGRSGTFFGYEGLGSIYWHMVSKLALAVQETFFRALDDGTDADTLSALADAYYDVRAGLGVAKTPAEFGAFPQDAYSHTPGGGLAKQPGMTGQVKEDILCRWGELGVVIEDGRIAFRPALLREGELLDEAADYHYVNVNGEWQTLALGADTLAFTYCGVPVVYTRSDTPALRVVSVDGTSADADDQTLSADASALVFQRTGDIARIEVDLVPAR